MLGSNFFADLIFGHLIGDYLLQSRAMALNKQGKAGMCFLHCVIYAFAVLAMTASYFPTNHWYYWWLFVFSTHFSIDYCGFADIWLEFIRGRSLRYFLRRGKDLIPASGDFDWENYWVLRGGFTALVYAVADNTLHLLALWFVAPRLL